MTTPDPRLREALAKLVKRVLTDEALDAIDTAASDAANHPDGGYDFGALWQAWRNGIADQLDGPLAEAWERSVEAGIDKALEMDPKPLSTLRWYGVAAALRALESGE